MADETLKITGGNATGQTITLEQELVIGRSTPGLGSLGGDSEISRVHARVFHDPSGRLTIEDLGSTNGTFVNGNRISGQQVLNPGDQVRVGQTSMTVEGAAAGATTVGNVITPPPAAAQPPPPAQVAATPPTQQQPPAQVPPPPGGGPGGPYAGGPIGSPAERGGGGGNRNLLIALAAILVIGLIVAGLAIGGVFGGDDEDKGTETTAQTTPAQTTQTTATTPTVAMPEPPPESSEPSSSGKYPSSFTNQFVTSCASGGRLSRSQCRCIINEAEDVYTLPEFAAAVRKAGDGNVPSKLRQIFVTCAS
jgi:hypothetical protein